MRIEAGDELAVAVGFGDPAADLGVGVKVLRGQHEGAARSAWEGSCGRVRKLGAVLAEVGVGAGILGLGAGAESVGEASLDRGGLFPVAGQWW